MAGPGNFIPDDIASSNMESPKPQAERVWPENSLVGLPPTGNDDLKLNPSFDVRNLMHNVEQIARRHWWDKDMTGPVGVGHTGKHDSSSQVPGYATKVPYDHIDQTSKDGK